MYSFMKSKHSLMLWWDLSPVVFYLAVSELVKIQSNLINDILVSEWYILYEVGNINNYTVGNQFMARWRALERDVCWENIIWSWCTGLMTQEEDLLTLTWWLLTNNWLYLVLDRSIISIKVLYSMFKNEGVKNDCL